MIHFSENLIFFGELSSTIYMPLLKQEISSLHKHKFNLQRVLQFMLTKWARTPFGNATVTPGDSTPVIGAASVAWLARQSCEAIGAIGRVSVSSRTSLLQLL